MAYDSNKPGNDSYLADFPPEMREQLRAIINDQIVDAFKLCGLSPGNAIGNIPVSNGTECVNLNAQKLGGNLPAAFASVGHGHGVATGSSNGFMANTDKSKLDGIAGGAEVNQNAFANVVVGDTTIQADAKSDSLTLAAGANIALTPDATNDQVTIALNGVVPITNGGTGAATAAAALTNLGVTATAAELNYVDGVTSNIQTQLGGKAPTSHASTGTGYGVASAANYGHAMASAATPLVAGTAAVGTDNGLYAREGHVHPAQTSVSGNAATATKLAAAKTIAGAAFDGSANIDISYNNLTDKPAIPTSYDTAHLFATSGYQTLSNGLIVQWGNIAAAGSSNFPIAFPNACLTVATSGNGSSGNIVSWAQIKITFTKTTVTAQSQSDAWNYIAIGY